jgi:hypothetical protein
VVFYAHRPRAVWRGAATPRQAAVFPAACRSNATRGRAGVLRRVQPGGRRRVKKINAGVNEALNTNRARIQDLGLIVSGKGLGDFEKMLNEETLRWKNVMRQANIKQQ